MIEGEAELRQILEDLYYQNRHTFAHYVRKFTRQRWGEIENFDQISMRHVWGYLLAAGAGGKLQNKGAYDI
jgi:hypothetical protein